MNKTLPPLPDLPSPEVEEWSESLITFRGEGWKKETVEKYATDYALASIEADRVSRDVPELCDPSCGTYDLASMILSDCGHSTNNQRLLDRVAARIDKRLAAVLAAAPQPQPVQAQHVGVFREDDDIGHVDLCPHQQMKLQDGDKLYAHAKQPAQAIQCEWTNCPRRVGDVCCNEQAKEE